MRRTIIFIIQKDKHDLKLEYRWLRAFLGRDIGLWKQLTMVRPDLEYAIQVWSPFLVSGITGLEDVKKNKIPTFIENIKYSDIWEAFKLTTLENRTIRAYLI